MFKRQLKAGKTKKLSGKSFRLKGSNLMSSTPGEDYSPPPEKLTVRAVQTVVVLVRGHEGPDQRGKLQSFLGSAVSLISLQRLTERTSCHHPPALLLASPCSQYGVVDGSGGP